jgi:hypothetical protein
MMNLTLLASALKESTRYLGHFNLGFGWEHNGRPILFKHASANVYYCNPAHPSASNSNTGLDPTLPLLTLNALITKAAANPGAWCLVPQGATINDGFGTFPGGSNITSSPRGIDLQYPMLISTYDAADPTNFAKFRQGEADLTETWTKHMAWIGFSANSTRFLLIENLGFVRPRIAATPAEYSAGSQCGTGVSWSYTQWFNCRFKYVPTGSNGGSKQKWTRCSFERGMGFGEQHGQGMYLDGNGAVGHRYQNEYYAFSITAGATPWAVGDSWSFSVTAGVPATAVAGGGNVGNGTFNVPVNTHQRANPLHALTETVTVTCVSADTVNAVYAWDVVGSVHGTNNIRRYDHSQSNGLIFHVTVEDCIFFHCGFDEDDRDYDPIPQRTQTLSATATLTLLSDLGPLNFAARPADMYYGPDTDCISYLFAYIQTGGVSTDQLTVRHQGNGAGQIGVSGTDVSYGGVVFGKIGGALGPTYAGYTGANNSRMYVGLRTNATDAMVIALSQNIQYQSTAGTPSGSRTIRCGFIEGNHNKWSDIFKHNGYFSSRTTDVVFRRNISGHACSHGLQHRGSGEVYENLFITNPIHMLRGNGDDYEKYRPLGVRQPGWNNTCVGSTNAGNVLPDRVLPRGWLAQFMNTTADSVEHGLIGVNVGTGTNVTPVYPAASKNIPSRMRLRGARIRNWGSNTMATMIGTQAFPAQCDGEISHSIHDIEPETGTNIQPASLVVPWRVSNISEADLATEAGYASIAAMWADLVATPLKPHRERLKAIADRACNAA